MTLTILTETDLRKCIEMDPDTLSAVEEGFAKLAQGQVTLPPILQVPIPEHQGELDVKTAYIHGLDSFAVKIAAGFLDNRSLGLPVGSGLMILFSTITGFPEAVLLDNGYLTDVRTGLAGAIAAKYLAPETVETAGVIGSGMQSRFQIQALHMVRPFRRLLVYGNDPHAVKTYAAEMGQKLGVEVVIAANYAQVVQQAQVVVTTTPASVPFIQAGDLHPGLHLTCMGSDSAHKQEVSSPVFRRVERIACDRKQQCFQFGELHHALEAGVISPESDIAELGELILGKKPGRQSAGQITLCDLTGVGVQDTAIARLAFQRAQSQNLGLSI
jgi:ectoine utilization protein EutC